MKNQQIGFLTWMNQNKKQQIRLLKLFYKNIKECQEFQMSNALFVQKVEDFQPSGKISIANGLIFAKKILLETPLYFSKVILDYNIIRKYW